MGLNDLIPYENTDGNGEEHVHKNDASVYERVQRKMFLKWYNDNGMLIPDPKSKRKVPETFRGGWIDVTDDVKTGVVKKTKSHIHYTFCECGSKVIFWTRGPWYRCYECNKVLINKDWKENWWKDNSGQSGLNQFS